MANMFKDVLTIAKFTTTPNGLTTAVGQPLEYAYRVNPKELVCLGTGEISHNGVANAGVLYVSIKDNSGTPVQVEGRYELLYANSSKTETRFIQGSQLDQIRASKTTRDAANVLPAQARPDGKPGYWWMGEYGWIILRFYPNTASLTIADANSDIQIPVTVVNL